MALRSLWPPHRTSNPCARLPWVQHLGSPYTASVSLRRTSIIFIQLLKCTVVFPAQNPFHMLLLRLSIVVLCSVMSNSLQPHGLEPTRLLCPWDFSGKNTGIGCHFLLQGLFLTQELNLHLLRLLHCKWILYYWATGEARPDYLISFYIQPVSKRRIQDLGLLKHFEPQSYFPSQYCFPWNNVCEIFH